MIGWLSDLVAPLNHVLFTVGNDHVSYAELLGFITGGFCVWLTVRQHVANFPVGIANSFFFLVLFISARLWADGVLQLLYIALGFIGWWQWLHGGENRSRLLVGQAGMRELAALLAFVVVGTAILYVVLKKADDIAPFWDALTTAISLAAQWLLNRKLIQTWFFWIAADLIYIPLYFSKHLLLTGIVYILFLGLCVRGYLSWKRSLHLTTPNSVMVDRETV